MPDDLVIRCKQMEDGYKEKCDEIKRQRYLLRKMITGVETATVGTNTDAWVKNTQTRVDHTLSDAV